MNIKRTHVPWLALTLAVLLIGGVGLAWGAPRDQWDYRQASQDKLPAVTITGDKTTPDSLKLYMKLYIQRLRDGDVDKMTDLAWHEGWFTRNDEAEGARQRIRAYGKDAKGAVTIDFGVEDPYDVRGGTIHYRSTKQREDFTVMKKHGLWLLYMGPDWNNEPTDRQPLDIPSE
ncbi:hypothetical protein ABZ153_09690 [Streptomyces sp. NPDC006290]|uniref:hypothetical protein n=1 Tax=Streptomyces sp. NPDC006290 TaxID=3156745 RepID=UPI0033AA4D25